MNYANIDVDLMLSPGNRFVLGYRTEDGKLHETQYLVAKSGKTISTIKNGHYGRSLTHGYFIKLFSRQESRSNKIEILDAGCAEGSPDSVTLARVIAEFRKREEFGVKKYGTNIDRKDLSLVQWLQHAKEEAMDKVLYLDRAIQDLLNTEVEQPKAEQSDYQIFLDRSRV